MKNMSKTKKRLNLLACAIIALAMALSCLSFTAGYGVVKAEEPKDNIEISISDGQFNKSGSSVLNSSSNWTGGYKGGYKGNVISGIINLGVESSTTDDFMDATKLDQYPEFASEKPTTPFGKDENKYPGTNTNVLMINTNDKNNSLKRGTAYGYTSSEIELSANSFYMFSVWVKTGKFVQDRGAVIKLSGFDYDIGFWNIDTTSDAVEEDKMLGFREYIIYVATSNSANVTINLQVGDYYTYGTLGELEYIEHDTPSSGYAFFDNVTCYRLSGNAFYSETYDIQSDRVLVHDFSLLKKDNAESDVQIDSFANGINDWKIINHEDRDSGVYNYIGIYDAGKPFDDDNEYGLDSDPYTHKGNRDIIGERNILVMSATSEANIGLESKEITINRNSFYRISAWVKTQNFDDNSNASMVLVGENNIAANNYELNPVVISGISGSEDMSARYGWVRYYFYVRGSIAKDCNVKLQLWLGYNNNCKGSVLFDDIRLEKLSYSFFNNNSSNGTLVTFDREPSTTIENGRFFNAANYGKEFPLTPVQWTAIGSVPEDAASGIILTDEKHYSDNAATYLNVPNPVPQSSDVDINSTLYPSMLLLASSEPSYFGYASPSLDITSDTYYKISVTMRTININMESKKTDSGANLWIEVNGNVIASIKSIQSSPLFRTYDFYLQGDTPFSSGTGIDYTATLNIALGSATKKATGSIYVAEAALTTINKTEFDEKYAEYKNSNLNNLSYDVYSFSAHDFFGYDKSDENAIKKTTSWSISDTASNADGKYVAGVFDPHHKDNNAGNAYLPKEITTAYDNLQNKFDKVFTLQTFDTAVTAQLINPIKLEANSYYMVTVSMAVILHDENNTEHSYGAGLYLSGSPYSDVRYTNIQTTDDLIDVYQFRNYQFYIETDTSDTNVYLRVSLGDASYINRYVSGEVYIAFIDITSFGSSSDDVEESEYLKIINKHVSTDDSNTDNDDNEDEDGSTTANDSEKWWLIPSILFGIAIVLAIVGSLIRVIVDKVSRRQRRKELNSYDRRFGYTTPDGDETEVFDDNAEQPTVEVKTVDQDIEAFNDDEPENSAKEVKEAPKPKAHKQVTEDDINKDFDD